MSVDGFLSVSGPGMQPWLDISASGAVNINTPLFVGSDVSVSGELWLTDNSGVIHFDTVSGCRSEGIITLEVSDLNNLTMNEDITVFSYNNGVDTSAFDCEIQVVDALGDELRVDMSGIPSFNSEIGSSANSRRLFSSSVDCVYGTSSKKCD